MEYFAPVNILDSGNFKILFASIQPMRVSVREERKATSFQVEDGTERSDHVVESAKEIALDLMLEGPDARTMYSQILQAWKDNTLVIVQTKVNSYSSMLIESISHDEAPEFGDGIAMPIRLKEWRSVSPQYGSLPPNKVKTAKQSDTVKSGQKQSTKTSTTGTGSGSGTTSPTERKASILFGVFN